MEADDEYRTNPSLPRLCHLLAELAYKWEKIETQSRCISGSSSIQSSDTRKKISSYDRDRDHHQAQPKPLADTQLSNSIYGTVVFDLTLFNEVTKSDNILNNIEANVIDSCIKVIIEMPDIRSHRLVHRIPSYFDSTDPTYLVPLLRLHPEHCAKAQCLVTTVHSL
jgi:hypothetical protein